LRLIGTLEVYLALVVVLLRIIGLLLIILIILPPILLLGREALSITEGLAILLRTILVWRIVMLVLIKSCVEIALIAHVYL
jgi:hypothetical protein